MHLPLGRFSRSLRSCGLRGHITYRPDEATLAARLHTTTAVGDAWRCLRCETFVPGPPQGAGPADRAPLVLRGRTLRDAFILRLLALERLLRGLLLVALAYAVYRYDGGRDSFGRLVRTEPRLLRPASRDLDLDLEQLGPVQLIEWGLSAPEPTLPLVAGGTLAFGVTYLVQAVGLWVMRRWGQYFAVVATSAFIPLEVYEILAQVTWVRATILLVNIAAVAYLVYSTRLFGLRGGYAAFEAARHHARLVEVERTAVRGPRGT